MEGRHCYEDDDCDQTGLALPILEYGHDLGCSVTGGYVYRGTAIPALQGHYFYADFCGGFVRSFRVEGGAAVDELDWPTLRPGGTISSFGEDAAGELYVLICGGPGIQDRSAVTAGAARRQDPRRRALRYLLVELSGVARHRLPPGLRGQGRVHPHAGGVRRLSPLSDRRNRLQLLRSAHARGPAAAGPSAFRPVFPP